MTLTSAKGKKVSDETGEYYSMALRTNLLFAWQKIYSLVCYFSTTVATTCQTREFLCHTANDIRTILFLIVCAVLVYRIKDLLQTFLSDNLGTSPDMPVHGGFSFADTAAELANDLIESLVVDVAVELDLQFGLDLNPMFNQYAISFPDPFIQINHFDLNGVLGINEWTSTIDFSGLEFSITGAKALLSVSSTISSSPIRLITASDFVALVNPPTENAPHIIFEIGVDVVFPVFLVYEGIGVGSRIEYM